MTLYTMTRRHDRFYYTLRMRRQVIYSRMSWFDRALSRISHWF